MTPKFTSNQGRYLAFIHHYTLLHHQPPAEADMQQYFRTSPPAVHQMVLNLEKRGLISRVPGQARSTCVLVPSSELPSLEHPCLEPTSPAPESGDDADDRVELVVRLARRTILKLFERNDANPLDDAEFAPLVRGVADAVEEDLREAGRPASEAAATRERVVDFAVDMYVHLCARNDPDGADADEDGRIFRYLMVHGEWPQRRQQRRKR